MAANAVQPVAPNSEYDFVEKPSEEYFCPVTFELLKDPKQTNACCGKHLSCVAAQQLEAEGKPCPLCKKAPLKTADDLFFKRKVMELKVRCSNKSAGCKWVGQLGGLDHHLKAGSVEGQCRFAYVRCPLECGKRVQRRSLNHHQLNNCMKRPFTCKYCDYKATHDKVINDHWPKCQRYQEVCPNQCSNDLIERRFLQKHLEEKCPKQKLTCVFSHAGCQAEMIRETMQEHLTAQKDEHLAMMSTLCKQLKDEIFDLKIAFSRIAPKPVFIPPSEMIMNNFDKFKTDDESWYTLPFYTHIGGYKMCLNIDSNGWGSGMGTHVSIYAYMMKGEFDSHLKWPFQGVIIVQLVNQKVDGVGYEKKLLQSADMGVFEEYYKRVFEGDRAIKAHGTAKFISHTDLYKPEDGKEYLKNDTLKFKVIDIVVTSV